MSRAFRAVGLAWIGAACTACGLGDIFSDVAQAIACGVFVGGIEAVGEEFATERPNGAYLDATDGGTWIDVYQTLPSGWLHLSLAVPIQSGDLNASPPDGGCPESGGFYHLGGQFYVIDAQVAVTSAPTTSGQQLNVELSQITYIEGDAGTMKSLPPVSLVYAVQK